MRSAGKKGERKKSSGRWEIRTEIRERGRRANAEDGCGILEVEEQEQEGQCGYKRRKGKAVATGGTVRELAGPAGHVELCRP